MSQVASHDAKPRDIIPTSTAIAARTITKCWCLHKLLSESACSSIDNKTKGR